MKYYLIVGEASGDLHASNLMRALKTQDPEAEFRFFGGNLMAGVGGTMVKHYNEMAYMGFIPVLLHARTILKNMRMCKKDIVEWNPDVVILVDYPGFNLNIAKFVRRSTSIPVFYYISPKIWAWKEYRIKNIRRDVDQLYSILPFEVDFFERKHHYPITYEGNPTLDEVEEFRENYQGDISTFMKENNLNPQPIIALLAGSRKQEIKDNLPLMLKGLSSFAGNYQLVLAAAPGIEPEYYRQLTEGKAVKIVYGKTYELLQHAHAALVTSGTATLETALFNVPQVVCYYTRMGKLVSFLKRMFLKVRFVSLVNLIANREVVRELVAGDMTAEAVRKEVAEILCPEVRQRMAKGYAEVAERLGQRGAPEHAARQMIDFLRKRGNTSKLQPQE